MTLCCWRSKVVEATTGAPFKCEWRRVSSSSCFRTGTLGALYRRQGPRPEVVMRNETPTWPVAVDEEKGKGPLEMGNPEKSSSCLFAPARKGAVPTKNLHGTLPGTEWPSSHQGQLGKWQVDERGSAQQVTIGHSEGKPTTRPEALPKKTKFPGTYAMHLQAGVLSTIKATYSNVEEK